MKLSTRQKRSGVQLKCKHGHVPKPQHELEAPIVGGSLAILDAWLKGKKV